MICSPTPKATSGKYTFGQAKSGFVVYLERILCNIMHKLLHCKIEEKQRKKKYF
jgi:hypothetical protein